MSLNIKQFGMVTVYTDENSVKVNWSCCGAVDLETAEQFYVDFGNALEYALQEDEKLGSG